MSFSTNFQRSFRRYFMLINHYQVTHSLHNFAKISSTSPPPPPIESQLWEPHTVTNPLSPRHMFYTNPDLPDDIQFVRSSEDFSILALAP